MQTNTENTIIVAIDIDDFLASTQISSLRKQEPLDPVHHSEDHFIMVEFDHNGHHHQDEHVLVPGCIEFFCFLFEQRYVRPAFFSSGIHTRNLDLAKKIVHKAIALCGDANWKNRYDVYSRENCFDTTKLAHHDETIRNKFQPEHRYGNYKKDLRMISYGRNMYQDLCLQTFKNPSVLFPNREKDEQLLKNVILVEEDASYMFPNQEKNILLCPTYRHLHPGTTNHTGEDTPYNPDRIADQFKPGNTIFYAAGVLNRTFERHFSEHLPIPEILWQEQGHIWMNQNRYKEKYPIQFFTEGRYVLQKYNPKLNFAVARIDS